MGGTHMGVAQRRSNQIYKQGDPQNTHFAQLHKDAEMRSLIWLTFCVKGFIKKIGNRKYPK